MMRRGMEVARLLFADHGMFFTLVRGVLAYLHSPLA
jgi:hypothetical protein